MSSIKSKEDETLKEILELAGELSKHFLEDFKGTWENYDKIVKIKHLAIELKYKAYVSGMNWKDKEGS